MKIVTADAYLEELQQEKLENELEEEKKKDFLKNLRFNRGICNSMEYFRKYH